MKSFLRFIFDIFMIIYSYLIIYFIDLFNITSNISFIIGVIFMFLLHQLIDYYCELEYIYFVKEERDRIKNMRY